MNKRNNKSHSNFFLLTLAVTSIFIIEVTALSGVISKVQADTIHVNSNTFSTKSNSVPVKSDTLSPKSASLPVQADNFIVNPNLPIAVIISREIKPFIEMVEGFESFVDHQVVRIFIDENGNPFSHDPLYKGTKIDNYSFVIAVGPLALSYILNNNALIDSVSNKDNELTGNVSNKNNKLIFTNNDRKNNPVNSDFAKKILYAMVLNPETIIPKDVSMCGISLNLFSEDTISKITQILPSVKKIGVLFDPANNSEWFKTAQDTGIFKKVKAIPLHIKEQSDVNSLNQKSLLGVDALLFIPDKTVTSPTVISHIIKQSVANKIPVIGYNSFFHKSGAALSFVLDYRKIGEQMAQLIIQQFSNRNSTCEQSNPAYHITLNRAVVDLLNLEIGNSLPLELKVEP
ncbi:MAG: hypothetical protein HQK72_04745 [Desulfamplus sp.]|nr:hypothetical protein [Desulfamplus sp.]